jgi:hypothetical protein
VERITSYGNCLSAWTVSPAMVTVCVDHITSCGNCLCGPIISYGNCVCAWTVSPAMVTVFVDRITSCGNCLSVWVLSPAAVNITVMCSCRDCKCSVYLLYCLFNDAQCSCDTSVGQNCSVFISCIVAVFAFRNTDKPQNIGMFSRPHLRLGLPEHGGGFLLA